MKQVICECGKDLFKLMEIPLAEALAHVIATCQSCGKIIKFGE